MQPHRLSDPRSRARVRAIAITRSQDVTARLAVAGSALFALSLVVALVWL